MKKLLLLILVSVVLLNNACQKEPEPLKLNSAIEAYLNELMVIMQTYSVNKRNIDWAVFRKTVLETAKGAKDVNDIKTSEAIYVALTQLKDNHSFFINAKGAYTFGANNPTCAGSIPVTPAADKEIGYVKVGAFSGTQQQADDFAQAIQNAIKAADSESLKGWIVDLRGNRGGNMWPMMGGIGPILGEGVAGYFIDPLNNIIEWGYKNGNTLGFQMSNPYILKKPNPRVAVFIDEGTASSGEAIAVAFKARPETKFFGMATCGLSTANQSYNMSDGAVLFLTVSTMVDRTKKIYGKKIEPDVTDVDQQRYIQEAFTWLKQ
ncbi:S41 family peptidase [Emticicia agri]|uniref:Peptidase S41 n=1 Tax=Emticicia agri TaxID=2492393 RepID=A0A4V1ZD79_9BACT|nr:S41 family peptidase [Emticicia agri]RYU95220.1 peptidase S41 [Emticicia agri]